MAPGVGRGHRLGQPAIKLTTILTDAQVGLLTEAVHDLLGPEFVAAAARLRVDTQKNVRFHAVAARCAEARQELGLDVKQVAARLKVPQYRLQGIERGCLSEIRGAVLIGYMLFLGLDSWLRRWVRANPGLASELGIDLRRSVSKARSGSSRPRGTPSNTAMEPPAPELTRARRGSSRMR